MVAELNARKALSIRDWLTLELVVTAGLLVVGFVVYLLSSLVRLALL